MAVRPPCARAERWQVSAGNEQISLPLTHGADPDCHRVHILALSKVKGLGETSLKALIRAYGDLSRVWDAPPEHLYSVLQAARLGAARTVATEIHRDRDRLAVAAHQDLETLARQGVRLITPLDLEAYPQRLSDLRDRPEWLFVHGEVSALSAHNLIAVVGTRSPSPQGVKKAQILTGWLADRGFGIVSGLAEGIDDAAHRAALAHGAPTLAILGTGLLRVFPASTLDTRKRIVEAGGSIVTEYFPNDTYSRGHFIRRNRIQAALAYATVPVEAGAASGTAHTYRFARDLARITFSVVSGAPEGAGGLLDTLRRDGQPVFDLDREDSMSGLADLLRPALERQAGSPTAHSSFRAALSAFEGALRSSLVAEADLQTFLAEVEASWEKISRGGSRSNS